MKLLRNILFSAGRYPEAMGARGLMDVEYVRYVEWGWMKLCVWLIGFIFAGFAGGMALGIYYEDYVKESLFWAVGIAWVYNGVLLLLLFISLVLSTLKWLFIKAFASDMVQASSAAARTATMFKKGGL